MAIDRDPNNTSARAANQEKVLSYPANEDLSLATRLRFVEYDRLEPSDTAQERTTSLITLPMPISIPDVSSIRTTQHDLGLAGNVSRENIREVTGRSVNPDDLSVGEITSVGKSLLAQSLKRNWTNIQQAALRGLAVSPFVTDGLRPTIQSFAGVVPNPHTTVLFEGVNLKTFNLEWRMSARSQQESDILRDIVNTIKQRAHPEEITSGFTLNYPDLVYVEFTGQSEQYLPKFQKAFINNIVYSPDSGTGLSFYKSGAPVAVSLQLQFTELNIITRDTLEEQEEEQLNG